MREWTLQGADIYGGVILINLAACRWKVGLTHDFRVLRAVQTLPQLTDIGWLDQLTQPRTNASALVGSRRRDCNMSVAATTFKAVRFPNPRRG